MADNLKERTIAIINDDEFNSLPFEERKKILKYVSKFNIQLFYQIIESFKSESAFALAVASEVNSDLVA